MTEKSILAVNIKSQLRPFIFLFPSQSLAAAYVCVCVCVFFFFPVCWYEETKACHNTLLVLCGREEPGSAPVTQLLTALVLVIWADLLDLSADSQTSL